MRAYDTSVCVYVCTFICCPFGYCIHSIYNDFGEKIFIRKIFGIYLYIPYTHTSYRTHLLIYLDIKTLKKRSNNNQFRWMNSGSYIYIDMSTFI